MDTCKYHPAQAATWHCPRCQMDLCVGCVLTDAANSSPRCSLCRGDLLSLGISQVVTPFWQRLPAFFAYGFRGSSLKFLVFCTLLLILGALIGRLPLLGMIAIATKYLFSVTEQTAAGELEPPSFGEVLSGSGFSAFFKQLGVLLFMGIFTFAVGSTMGTTAGWLVAIFIMVGYPASTMLLAATGSFVEAISPIAIIQVIRGIGWPYALLYGFLFLLSQSGGYVSALALAHIPTLVSLPLTIFAMLYFSVVMFNMMGYTLYQYHHELGLPVRREVMMRNLSQQTSAGKTGAAKTAAAPVVNNSNLVEAEVLIKEGRYEQALQSLQAAINQEPERFDIHEKLHQLLLLTGNDVRAQAHLDDLLELLMSKRQLRKGVKLLTEMQARVPDFRPRSPEVTLALAEAMHASREDKAALRLVLNMHKRHPKFEGIPRAYFLAARIFSERLRDDAQAIKLLEFLTAHYPDAAEMGEISQYLGVLRASA